MMTLHGSDRAAEPGALFPEVIRAPPPVTWQSVAVNSASPKAI